MKENRYSPRDNARQGEQDRQFNMKAAEIAKNSALKKLDKRADKEIKLDTSYTKDQLLIIFDLTWEQMEEKLKEKFEFTVEGENVTFTKIKEQEKTN